MGRSEQKLILATNNEHKVFEIREMLRDTGITVYSASDFREFPEIEETGSTLEENALLKALAIHEKYGLACMADDTGLEVEYLDGAPGVFSARFAGPDCSFAQNNEKLLGLLRGVPIEKRKAVFRTVIAFVDADGRSETVEGTLEGFIGLEPWGSRGFGYDPVFMVGGRTLAEMTPEEKNSVSHRGEALRKIKPILMAALSNR